MIRKLNRTKIFAVAFAAALALPAVASANCGTLQGSFAVTCEQGVQVFRHQSLSSFPRGISPQEAMLEAERIRANTAQARIGADARTAATNARLREREIQLDDFNARVFSRFTRNRSASFVGSDGFGGFNSGFGGGFGGGFIGNGFVGTGIGFNSSNRPRSAFRQKDK